jgi:opacity protein-like surface antigen
MRSAFAALLAAGTLLVPGAGRAQPVSTPSGPGPSVWLAVHLGASIPQAADLDGVDTGYDLGASIGARFTPYLGVEGSLGYVRASGTEAGVERTVWDLPIAANLRVRAPGRVVEPSAFAGVALHVASLTVDSPAAGGTVRATDEAVAFGFQVGAALDFHVTQTMLFGAEVQRSFVEPRFDGTAVRLDALRVAVALTHHF